MPPVMVTAAMPSAMMPMNEFARDVEEVALGEEHFGHTRHDRAED
jgi:hypothetical protein